MRDIVVYIGNILMPDKSASAHRVVSIAKSLRDIGFQTVIIGLDEQINDDADVIKTKRVYNGFDSYCLKYPKSVSEWLRFMWTVKPFLRVIQKYNVKRIHSIFALDFEIIPLYKLKAFCKKNGIRLVTDTVEWYDKSVLPFPKNIAKDIDTKLRMDVFYPKVDNMICISKYLYNHYKPYVKNIILVPGTVDSQEEKWSHLKAYKGNEVLTIGYGGNPGDKCTKERFDWLVQAVCELNAAGTKCILKAAGFDYTIIERNFPEITSYPHYKECIKYFGKMSHVDCLNLIRTSDFSVIVRDDKRVTKAGFPTKFSESLACGTPVITTASSNVADYIEEGVNGIVTDGFSVDALKEAIIKAASYEKEQLINMHNLCQKTNKLDYRQFNQTLQAFMK